MRVNLNRMHDQDCTVIEKGWPCDTNNKLG